MTLFNSNAIQLMQLSSLFMLSDNIPASNEKDAKERSKEITHMIQPWLKSDKNGNTNLKLIIQCHHNSHQCHSHQQFQLLFSYPQCDSYLYIPPSLYSWALHSTLVIYILFIHHNVMNFSFLCRSSTTLQFIWWPQVLDVVAYY